VSRTPPPPPPRVVRTVEAATTVVLATGKDRYGVAVSMNGEYLRLTSDELSDENRTRVIRFGRSSAAIRDAWNASSTGLAAALR
jgi:hypothetical protein